MLLLTWTVTQIWWVRQPLSEETVANRSALVLQAASLMQAGTPMLEVEELLGVDLRLAVGSAAGPPQVRGGWGWPFEGPWRTYSLDGSAIWERPGPEHEVSAWMGSAWVVLHCDVDTHGLPLLGALLLAASPLLAGTVWLTHRIVRPVEAAEAAMARIHAGELDLRLDAQAGPPELRRMARVVNGLAQETQRLIQQERERMAGLSHEMRTPLTRARLELELVRRADQVDPEAIDRVEAELETVDTLISELLELAHLGGGRRELREEVVDLRGLVEALADDEEDEQLQISGQGEALGDPVLLRRAVSNLLRNCRVHAQGAPRSVHVTPSSLEVRDSGPGIPAHSLSQAKDPFWRGESQGPGHGLGLAIVDYIARLHQGRLVLENRAGLCARIELGPPTRDDAAVLS